MNKAFFRNANYKHGEPDDHFFGKQIIRRAVKGYVDTINEEIHKTVDLHDIPEFSELYPKGSIRPYKLDLMVTKRRGEELDRIGIEIDGEYHKHNQEKDAIRDIAIPSQYAIRVVRFDKEALMNGDYTDEEIRAKLGL